MILPLVLLLTLPPTQASLREGFDTHRLAAIPARMKQFVADGALSGNVILVTRNGKTVLSDATGFANLDTRQPMRTDTIFQVMSMTKPVTALAVVMCAEKGLLNLDDPVERYLPAFTDIKVKEKDQETSPRSKVTIRHLLTHTSGFSSNDPGGLDDDEKIRLTLEEYANHFGSDPLQAHPGTRVAYSGPGLAAAGRIVEIVTNQPLQEFMEKQIFQPLGMTETSFFVPVDKRPRLAWMYDRSDSTLQSVDNPYKIGARYANPAGGLYSTASDMEKLLQIFLNGGASGKTRILSPAGVRAMTTIQTGNGLEGDSESQGWALGFSVIRSNVGGATLRPVGSFGHTGAYGTEFWADPATKIAVVYMAQTWDDRPRKTFNTMVNAALLRP